MYVILPFEPEFYETHNYKVNYFGHPLVEIIEKELTQAPSRDEFIRSNKLEEKPIMALLAGSRIQEVRKILPEMMGIVKYYSDYQFIIAGISSVPDHIYNNLTRDQDVKILYGQTYSLLKNSEVALVASGTATIETALAEIPQVVCYKTSKLSYLISKWLIKIRFISLVNLIMDKEVVKELIQDDLNERNLNSEINSLITGGWKREIMKMNYRHLKKKLIGKDTSYRIADNIVRSLIMINNVN
jgi:lipid-A-disaccharide synthase